MPFRLSLAPIHQIYYGWTKGMLAFLERMGDKGAKLKLSIDTMLLVRGHCIQALHKVPLYCKDTSLIRNRLSPLGTP